MLNTKLVITKESIVCPRGNGVEGAGIIVELARIAKVESRIVEISFVTPQKAPELLATFNEAWLALHGNVMMLELEVISAERVANSRRSVVILDEAPRILKEKKLATDRSPAGSEDLRRAVLEQDEHYQDALERVEQIRAVVEMLRGKLKAIEMAYSSVKKIIGEDAYNMTGGVGGSRTPALSGGTGDADAGETIPPQEFGGAGGRRPSHRPLLNYEYEQVLAARTAQSAVADEFPDGFGVARY